SSAPSPDAGEPRPAGSPGYDPATQRYTLSGAGTNMWDTRDEFRFVSRRLTGDFIVRAHVSFVGAGADPHRKIGWMIRRSLEAGSAYVDAAVHGDGLASLQYRPADGAETAEIRSTVTAPDVVQLERSGTTYRMSVARFGEPFTTTELTGVDLGDTVHVGLFVCSHNPDVAETAVFSNVRIVVPPPAGWRPYRDYIGSNLEVMTVADGARLVVYTTPDSLQAPNWTVDGRALIYNRQGRLFRFDLATRRPTLIDTGFATR